MRDRLLPLLVTSAFLIPGVAFAQTSPMNRPMMARPMPGAAATPADLVRQVAIPYQRFKLANGLTVIVHEDRKAPVRLLRSPRQPLPRRSPVSSFHHRLDGRSRRCEPQGRG
jgi:hypothetical protein